MNASTDEANDPAFGEVNLDDRDVKAYLVKLPEFLFHEFEGGSRENGSVVGRLRIPNSEAMAPVIPSVDGDGDASVERPKLLIDNPVNSQDENPRQYTLFFPDQPADIVLMSWKPSGPDPDMRIQGRVRHQCDARPPLNDAYRSINRRRVEDAAQKFRETVYMDEGERIAAQNRSVRLTALAETTQQKEERQKRKQKNRQHLDVPDAVWKKVVKTALFRAFENQLHYTAEELAKDIDEPLLRLRPVLNEICTYNKSGPFSQKYELKDEYKTVAQRQQKERELEDYRLSLIDDVKRRREERAQNERERSEPALKRSRLN